MRRGYQIAWWLALAAVVLIQIPPTVLYLLFPAANPYLLSLVGECFLVLPIGAGMLLLQRNGMPLQIGRTYAVRKTGYYIFLPLAVSRFIILATMPLTVLLNVLFGPQPDAFSQMLSVWDIFWAFVVLCIAAPILEELLCRGVMMQLLESYGALTAVFVSALIFTLMHVDIHTLAPIFFLGVLFGMVRYSSGSLFACIVMHAAFNGTSLLSMLLYKLNADWMYALTMCTTVVLAVLAPILLWRYLRKEHPVWHAVVTDTSSQKLGVSVGMLLFLALVIGFNGVTMLNWIVSGDWLELFSQSGF